MPTVKPHDHTKIKSFKAACKDQGENPTAKKFTTGAIDTRAYEMLKVIVKAINGPDYEADYMNPDQEKYEIVFRYDREKKRFSYHRCIRWRATTTAGSRLQFKSGEKAKFCATVPAFEKIWNDFLTGSANIKKKK